MTDFKRCVECGQEFDVSEAKRIIGRKFGTGTYVDMFPDCDRCEDCAADEIGSAMNEGASILECMPYEWD